jgi:hypothetical protein
MSLRLELKKGAFLQDNARSAFPPAIEAKRAEVKEAAFCV